MDEGDGLPQRPKYVATWWKKNDLKPNLPHPVHHPAPSVAIVANESTRVVNPS